MAVEGVALVLSDGNAAESSTATMQQQQQHFQMHSQVENAFQNAVDGQGWRIISERCQTFQQH